MQMELSEEQARELAAALALHLYRLQAELVHTDDRQFQEGLKRTYDCLEQVRRKLDAHLQQSAAYG